MSVFPGFGGWINQNIQQPPKAESRRSENVKSNLVSEKDTNNEEGLNYEEEEMKRQHELWKAAEKKHPWYDAPPKVKATKSRKVLKKDGPRQIVRLKKAVAWDFLWWSGDFPIHLIVDVNKKDLTAKYKKEKMMFMKVFEGNWKIEPLYVDSVRLCKHKEPKSLQEYKTCSGGQGRVASKVTMDQYFQPYTPFNLPPISWFIRDITIRTTKTLLKMLQHASVVLRE
ncbi:hypothetical protein ARALYDRAFT_313226 [Arabidopsis lyrata subsp. lyrata]|uniref:DUF220 domain-containing protein n=1 Tax=Arabidopsis lyrata subsp. lyrata TaxID=81972 RepID=D7KNH7_ARALL|nr:hypothetical protein ARALYDRAFT_313226 [Arabidopsis lyrata subsp. lyrata]